jgi:hypothetical protein
MKVKKVNQKEIRQTLTLKENLYQKSLKRAEFIGLSYPEYLRNLIVNDLYRQELPVHTLTEEEEVSLAEAMEDVKHGRVSPIDSVEDFVNSL